MASKRKHEIPLSPIIRILKQAGIPRVSRDAAINLRNFLEKVCLEIAYEAAELVKHDDRRIVTQRDIDYAKKQAIKTIYLELLSKESTGQY